MDAPQYSTLMEVLADVPDPRQRRGKRHAWVVLLTLISAALVCQHRTGRAMGQWVEEHAQELLIALPLSQPRLPSTSTLRRALRHLDVAALEERLAHFTHTLAAAAATAAPWQGQAVDGKAVRGAGTHGAPVQLVSLVQHGTGIVRKQVRVPAKRNEISAVPIVLSDQPLQGTVTTMDALLTQREIARPMLEHGGHYLMVVKANQPELYAAIDVCFQDPLSVEPTDDYQRYTVTEKGHGRLATRTLERSCALNGYLHWPGVGQVLRRTCERITLRTGVVSGEVTYGITSLPPQLATAAQVEALWRGHWGIENKVHHVRDVTMGEDGGQMRCGAAPQALAALRNGIISLLRSTGAASIADGLRHHGASPQRALALIGIPP